MADAGLKAVLLPKSELARQDGPLSLRVSAGPGSGQRPEAAQKEMVEICSQGRKWTNCRGGAGMAAGMSPPDPPTQLLDAEPSQEVPGVLAEELCPCWVGACPVPPPVPAIGF